MGAPFTEDPNQQPGSPHYSAGAAQVPQYAAGTAAQPQFAAGPVPVSHPYLTPDTAQQQVYAPADLDAAPRRRRGLWVTVIAIAVVVVLAGGVVGYLTVSGRWSPTAGTASPATAAPATQSSTSPSAGASATGSAPDGAIAESELKNATLDIPAWPATSLPCPTKAQKFTNGTTAPTSTPSGDVRTSIGKIAYIDVDHDGANETVVLLACTLQGANHQIAVFDRNAAGQIVTLGQVLAETTEIRNFYDVSAGPNGTVKVEVGDLNGCCGFDPTMSQHQTRGYSWSGAKFSQSDGPTSFPPNPRTADLYLTTNEVVFTLPSGGVRHGSLSLTVHNGGPGTVAHSTLSFRIPIQLKTELSGWNGCTQATPSSTSSTTFTVTCPVPALAPGATKAYLFNFSTTASPSTTATVLIEDPRTDQDKTMRNITTQPTATVTIRSS